MKKLFQNRSRHLNGRGIRGKRRLACSRGTGHSSSRLSSGGSQRTGLRSMMMSRDTMTVRDQYETS